MIPPKLLYIEADALLYSAVLLLLQYRCGLSNITTNCTINIAALNFSFIDTYSTMTLYCTNKLAQSEDADRRCWQKMLAEGVCSC